VNPAQAPLARAFPVLTRDGIAAYLYIASIYFVVVGVLNLWGYWNAFQINILEYIGLSDILKLPAYPVVCAGIFMVSGAVISELLIGRTLPPGGGANAPVALFARRHFRLIASLYILGIVLLSALGPVTKWQVLPFLVAAPIYLVAQQQGFLVSFIPHTGTRSIVIFILVIEPLISYGQGKFRAQAVLDGTKYTYLAADTVEGLPPTNPADPKLRVKYLGHANDYVFFLLPGNSTVVITRMDKTKGLHLKQFESSHANDVHTNVHARPKSSR
jgi:hypothetical protein